MLIHSVVYGDGQIIWMRAGSIQRDAPAWDKGVGGRQPCKRPKHVRIRPDKGRLKGLPSPPIGNLVQEKETLFYSFKIETEETISELKSYFSQINFKNFTKKEEFC